MSSRILLIAALTLAIASGHAEAGRLGGPITDSALVMPGQSLYFDVSFVAGFPAEVAIASQYSDAVELYVYDGDGNVTRGVGLMGRRLATIDVYRTGPFRVELRNTGYLASTVVVQTN